MIIAKLYCGDQALHAEIAAFSIEIGRTAQSFEQLGMTSLAYLFFKISLLFECIKDTHTHQN